MGVAHKPESRSHAERFGLRASALGIVRGPERATGGSVRLARGAGWACNEEKDLSRRPAHGGPEAPSLQSDQPTSPAMLLDQLHAQKEAIEAAARQFGARRIRVFGSVARGDERPDSDIDFLVDFPPGYDLFAQRLPLAQRLSEITGRALDLIPEHELNAHLRDAVLREAIEL